MSRFHNITTRKFCEPGLTFIVGVHIGKRKVQNARTLGTEYRCNSAGNSRGYFGNCRSPTPASSRGKLSCKRSGTSRRGCGASAFTPITVGTRRSFITLIITSGYFDERFFPDTFNIIQAGLSFAGDARNERDVDFFDSSLLMHPRIIYLAK